MKSAYAELIAQYTGRNPRHIEAWMRLEHGTLDGLSRAQFRREVKIAESCIDAAGDDKSEELAQGLGL